MAEKIIYDIQFNGFEKAKSNLEEITRLQLEQKKEIAETQKTIKDYNKQLDELTKEIAKNGTATAEQEAREQELRKSITDTEISLASQKDELSKTNKVRRDAVNAINTMDTALNAEMGSNEQLKAQLKLLTAEYNLLGEEERENTEAGQQLTSQINQITEKLKENESAIGDNRRKVGSYEEAITNALGKVNIMGVNLGQVTKSIKSNVEAGKGLIKSTTEQATATTAQATAQKGAVASSGLLSNAMKVLKVALISTGIGAIVVALGALVGAFLSTQRGADALSRVITPIKFVIQGLLGVLQDLSFVLIDKVKKTFDDISKLSIGEIFKKIGDSIKDNVLNRIEAFSVAGKAISKILSGDLKSGFKDLGNSVIQFGTGIENGVEKLGKGINAIGGFIEDVGDKVEESAKQGLEYANAVIALEKAQASLKVATAQTNKDLQEQRLLASDQTKSTEERITALQKASDLTNKLSAQEKSLVQQQLDLAVLKTKQNDTDRAAYQEIADLQAQLINLDAEAFSAKKRINSELTGLQKKQIDQENTRLEKLQEVLRTEEEKLTKERDNQLESLGLQKEATELTEVELQAREKIFENYYNQLAKNQFKAIQEQLKDQEDDNAKINLENEKWYYEQLQLLGDNEEAKRKLQDEYAQKNLTALQDEIKAQIQIIESKLLQVTADESGGLAESILTDAQKEELKSRLQELQTKLAKTNYEYSQIGKDPETGEPKTIADAIGINEEQAENLKNSYNASMQAITDILNIANQSIQQRTEERIAKIDEAIKKGVISEEEGEIKKQEIRKEAFEKQKKIEIATATIQYLQGLVSAWAQAMSYGFPLNLIFGGISTGILSAVFGLNIKKIKSQKFKEGGLINGNSHAKGGVPFTVKGKSGFEAEGGEYIQKKKAVDYYGVDFMNAINNMKIPKLFEQGGLVAPTPLQSTGQQVSRNIEPIANKVVNQKMEVINVESKFTKLQKQVSNVESATTY